MPVRGVDVSSYQGQVDWAAVKESGLVQFAYAKASEGLHEIDPEFARNKAVCAEREIPFGAYHYFHPEEDPVEQAAHFQNAAKPRAGDLLPMVDVEENNGVSVPQLINALRAFFHALGTRCILYTYYAFWNDIMRGSAAFASVPLWVAEYNSDAQPTLPGGWSDWALWQYSQTGHVPGIDGNVDLDLLNSRLALQALQV